MIRIFETGQHEGWLPVIICAMVDRWEKRGSQPLHDYGFLRLRKDRYRHPDLEGERDFLVIDARDWVNVVAVTPDEQIVLIRQFRYGVGDTRWEVPAGVIEPDEAPIDAGMVSIGGQAEAIAADIRRLHDEADVPWGHFAVLLRATTAQNALLEAFRRWGPEAEGQGRLGEGCAFPILGPLGPQRFLKALTKGRLLPRQQG